MILVYDVAAQDSFRHAEEWLSELDTYSTKKDVVKMLVGNKIDKVVHVCVRVHLGDIHSWYALIN